MNALTTIPVTDLQSREATAARPLIEELQKREKISCKTKDQDAGCDIHFYDDGNEICTLFIGKDNTLKISVGGEIYEEGSIQDSNDINLAINAFLKPATGLDCFLKMDDVIKNLTDHRPECNTTTLQQRIKQRINHVTALTPNP